MPSRKRVKETARATMADMPFVPQDVTGPEMAFGGGARIPHGDWQGNEFMPAGDKIPPEFHRHKGTKWNELVGRWFFNGLPAGTGFVPVPGIDSNKAINHIRTIMGSWTPKHEHKESACAYLLSLWFSDVVDANGASIL